MEENNNSFSQKLSESKKKLQECQVANQLDSCLKCEKVIGCDTRSEYVKNVYESMNKGEGGDFEF